jgi:hypothetical protein
VNADLTTIVLVVYAAGVVIGLFRTDARWPARVGLALLWPVGPLAFVLTVSVLLVASVIAFPVVGVILLALALAIAVLA